MDKVIIKKALDGFPIWGTCAGLILISNKIIENAPEPLKLINITTSRNFYGRQIDSFVEKNNFEDEDFEAIFIRAPKIVDTKKISKYFHQHMTGRLLLLNQIIFLG